MGWWSETVLGGDEPYDWLSEFGHRIGADYFDDSPTKVKNALNKTGVIAKLIRHIQDEECNSGSLVIGGQVLGVMIMESGAKMTPKTRAFLLDCAESDDWATENETRKKYIDAFIEQIKKYPSAGGKRAKVKRESLLEVLDKAMENGETGLVNK